MAFVEKASARLQKWLSVVSMSPCMDGSLLHIRSVDERQDRLSSATANVSVFIMTRDEEANLARCLDSVRWSNDVVLLDSGSCDRTVEIAASYPNVRVFVHPFDNFSAQRNRGLHETVYANPWILVLDADEVVEPALALEVLEIAHANPPASAFILRRRVMMNDRPLHWNIAANFWIARLVRPKQVRYEGIVHEQLHFNGAAKRLRGRLEHHQFHKGLEDWFRRRAAYARLEAEAAGTTGSTLALRDLLSQNPLERRRVQKAVFYKLPCRWLVYLLYSLVVRLAFLDGLRGLRYVWLETRSQYLGASNRNTI